MKLDFKQIQNLVGKSSEIISKVSSVQKVLTDRSHESKGKTKKGTVTSQTIKSSSNIPLEQRREKNPEPNIKVAVSRINSLTNPMEVATAIDSLIRQANETIQFCEEQKTIRTKIRAQSEVEISRINAMADMVRDYLTRSFDERSEIFDSYFSVLDQALKDGDNTLVAQTLQSINSLAASNPFKNLTNVNKVTEQLIAGTEWDI